jgi:hypothetical protein
MTQFRAELRSLGLTCRSFAKLTGKHEETVTGWGTVRHGNLQAVPLWAWRLVEAWKAAPHALAACEAPPDGFSP